MEPPPLSKTIRGLQNGAQLTQALRAQGANLMLRLARGFRDGCILLPLEMTQNEDRAAQSRKLLGRVENPLDVFNVDEPLERGFVAGQRIGPHWLKPLKARAPPIKREIDRCAEDIGCPILRVPKASGVMQTQEEVLEQ